MLLTQWPEVSGAKRLSGKLSDRWRMRTGDYRVQFFIERNGPSSSALATGIGFMIRRGHSERPDVSNIDDRRKILCGCVPASEFERLRRLARADDDGDLPSLPAANPDGTFPAIEYSRASVARKIIRRRRALGLSQTELARRAGVRLLTLERFESGTASPDVRAVDKIDRALKAAETGH